MEALPDAFVSIIRSTFGLQGERWLAGLPDLLEESARRWSLTFGTPFSLSFNYVVPARRAGGAEVVLKLGVPNSELTTGTAALQLYDGRGAVRLLGGDPESGVLLLERVNPGTLLYELRDDERATEIAAGLMRRLWCPPPSRHPFPDLYRWSRALRRLRDLCGGTTGPIPERLADMAMRVFDELIASSPPPVVLHGDLHHFNILRRMREGQSDEEWVAIDPKGIVGDPAFEIGPWLLNPMPDLLQAADPRGILMRRIGQFDDLLGFDRQRLLAWGAAFAVLSACWSLEDNGDPGWVRSSLAVAELLTVS